MNDSADTEIREALLAYTGDGPPLTFGYEQVLRSGRRGRRRRRLAVGGAAVAVVAVAALLALPRGTTETAPKAYEVAGPAWSAPDPAPYCRVAQAPATGPTVAPTTVVNEKNGFGIRIPTEPADHAAARISCYLAKAVPPLLPGATYHRDVTAPAATIPLQAYPSRIFDPARPRDTTPPGITASAVITDDQGVGDIGFGVGPAYESETMADSNCGPPACEVRGGPHGETVTVLDVRTSAGYHLVNINVFRGDTIIFAGASNGVPDEVAPDPGVGQTADDRRPGRKDLPLTVEQLIAVAAAPELDLFP